jgi:hypothetical protein
MENQYCIFLVGRMEDFKVDVVGVKMIADFEFIEIMGDEDPYRTFLGIDWGYDNYVIIDLNMDTMTFEVDRVKVIHPLDPYMGDKYTNPVDNNMEVEVIE